MIVLNFVCISSFGTGTVYISEGYVVLGWVLLPFGTPEDTIPTRLTIVFEGRENFRRVPLGPLKIHRFTKILRRRLLVLYKCPIQEIAESLLRRTASL